MSYIVIAVAARTYSASHKLFHDDRILRVKVEHDVNWDIVLRKKFGLSYSSRHAVEQHDFDIFVLDVSGMLDNIYSCQIINKMAFSESFSQLSDEGVFLLSFVSRVDNFSKVIPHTESRVSKMLVHKFTVSSLSDSRGAEEYNIPLDLRRHLFR